MSFAVHTLESAPEGSRPLLQTVKEGWGFVPNLQAMLAESPLTLELHEALFAATHRTTLAPTEAQLALLAISVFHRCTYCAAGHTFLARKAHAPEAAIQAVRAEVAIGDARLEALRRFVVRVVETRGFAGDEAVEAFLAAGYTRAQVFEILLLVALKTISNYADHLAHVPEEKFMADPALNWRPKA